MRDTDNEIYFSIEGKSYKPYIFILATILMVLMQVLSSSGNNTSQAIVTVYFSIVLTTVTIYKISWLGIVSASLSSLLFLLSINQDVLVLLIIVGANTIQAFLIWVGFRLVRFTEEKETSICIETLGMLVCGVFYLLYNIVFVVENNVFSSITFAVILCLFIIGALRHKRKERILFLVFIVLIPNFVGAGIGSFQDRSHILDAVYCNNFCRWFFTNIILTVSFGYPFVNLLKGYNFSKATDSVLRVKLSTVLYFAATILWNLIIFSLYYIGWLNQHINSYFFPWFVGNLFFIANMFLSVYPEVDPSCADRFQWYEQRSVVAENNTQMLVAIISFLLPICAQLIGTITYSISILFILNITSAIVYIGLIWIPKEHIRYMSAIKHLKSVFHLFTLSLLLLNIVLIINESIVGP